MAMLHSLIARRRFGPQTQWRSLRKTLTSGLGLDDWSLAWPAVVQLFVFICSVIHTISYEYYSLFIIVMNLIFMFSLWCIDWVGCLYAKKKKKKKKKNKKKKKKKKKCISVLRVALGPRVKLAGRKSALTRPPPPPLAYSADRSKAVVPVVILFVALWFILRGELFYVWCYIVIVFFSPFSIAITSLWEERANLSAFSTLFRFALLWFCMFPLPLGVWDWLRLVIVALPGLFSYLF